jgi:hypothetical protein
VKSTVSLSSRLPTGHGKACKGKRPRHSGTRYEGVKSRTAQYLKRLPCINDKNSSMSRVCFKSPARSTETGTVARAGRIPPQEPCDLETVHQDVEAMQLLDTAHSPHCTHTLQQTDRPCLHAGIIDALRSFDLSFRLRGGCALGICSCVVLYSAGALGSGLNPCCSGSTRQISHPASNVRCPGFWRTWAKAALVRPSCHVLGLAWQFSGKRGESILDADRALGCMD